MTKAPTSEPDNAPSVDVDDALTPEELAAQWEAEAPPAGGRAASFFSTLVAVAVGVAGMLLSLQLGLGSPAEPAPGMWPFVVSVALTLVSLAQLVAGRQGGAGEKFSKLSWLPVIGILTLVGMVALMPVIGFEIPSLLLSLVWMKFLGGESWRSAVLYSLIVVAAFYGIFILALGTSIPHLF